jgi:hypothetical protein
MHPGFLDVLHDCRDVRLPAVTERVDVDLDRAFEEPIDQDALAALRSRNDRGTVVADLHVAPAEHVRGPGEHRVADRLGDIDRLLRPLRDRPGWDGHVEPVAERCEPLPVLSEVDRVERRAEDPVPGLLDRAGELERGLPAELDDHALGLLALADGQHLLDAERFEVEAVRDVVVGRDRLRVAVDHHGLVAKRSKRMRGVDAAVVEFDPLADAVRPRAEDHYARVVAGRRCLVHLAPARSACPRSGSVEGVRGNREVPPGNRLIRLAPSGVEVVRGSFDLAGA